MKFLARLFASIAAPFILLFGGAGVVGLGVEYQQQFLVWGGLLLVAIGVIWILVWWLLDSG